MNVWSGVTIVGLVGVCVVNVVATANRVPPPPRLPAAIPANIVVRQEQRLVKLRLALESRGVRGALGYLTDVPASELSADPRGMEEYFVSQFALVPWVLDARATDSEWIIANLHDATAGRRLPEGYRVVDDCGDGVFLLRKMEQAAP